MNFVLRCFKSIFAKFSMSSSPIRTMEKRFDIIEGYLALIGMDTYREGWKAGPVCTLTTGILVVSFVLDFQQLVQRLHSGQERVADMTEAFLVISTQATCLYRLYIFIRYRHVFRSIIHKLKTELCQESLVTPESRLTMSRSSRRGWLLFRLDLLLRNLIISYYVVRTLEDHKFLFPAFSTSMEQYFYLMFLLQLWALLAQVTLALASNNLFHTLVVLVCSHLEGLALRARSLGSAETAASLGELVRSHDYILGFVVQINTLYKYVLCLQPLYTGVVIVASTLLYDESPQANLFLQIAVAHIIELFLFCYIGDLIKEKSAALCDQLYACDWHAMPTKEKKIILQIMHRCQKPVTMDAGIFGPLTLEMYSKSMQMTYSMWTVFKRRTI